jgi:hypothetical protein
MAGGRKGGTARRTTARVMGSTTGAADQVRIGRFKLKRANTGGSMQPQVQLGPSQHERSAGAEGGLGSGVACPIAAWLSWLAPWWQSEPDAGSSGGACLTIAA